MYTGKICWITGASSGIGEALALELARQGARLVLSARRADELRRVANQTGLSAADVLVLPFDMTDLATLPAQTDKALAYFGRLDYVFLNAGLTQRGTVVGTDFPVYRQLMELNFFSVVALTQAVLPHFLQQRSGHFIVTSSVAGKIGIKQRSGYCASKHALHGFFDALRAEVAPDGVAVTLLCPGYIQTPISLSALDAHGRAHGKMDSGQSNGMPADELARRTLRGVAAGKRELFIGGSEIMGVYLKRLWPGLLATILQKRKADGT